MTNIKKLGMSLATFSMLAVGMTGCGSSDSNSDGSTGTETGSSLSGTVADGYLVGATVCLDKNDNSKCDANEPRAVTQAHGKYTIADVSSDDLNKYPLLAEIDKTVIDEDDNQTISQDYLLSAEPGKTFISPISTMIREYKIKNELSYDEAKNRVKELLGINDDTLLEADYIASELPEAQNIHKKAQIIAKLKENIREDLHQNYQDLVDIRAVDKYIDDKIIEKLSDIKTEIDSNKVDLNTSIQNITSVINLNDANSELSRIVDKIEQQELQELESNMNATLQDLTSSATIQQDVKYTKVYNGGTDFKTYTVADSIGKSCNLYILDSTYAYNPYTTEPYMVNGESYDGFSPTGKQFIGSSVYKNSSFRLTWQYYTTENSHFDFFVHCEDREDVNPVN